MTAVDPDGPAVFAVIDMIGKTRPYCGNMIKINNLKRANYKGLLLVIDDEKFLKNHCRMYDDNHFFVGVMDSGTFAILNMYKIAGEEKQE